MMSNVWTLWRREMGACFLSPIAFVTMAIFLLVSNGAFVVSVLRNLGGDAALSSLLFGAISLALPILVTVITMRLFAEEKRSGTLEILMTAPVKEIEVVLGKYLGALTFALLVLAPAVAVIFLLNWISPGVTAADVDPGSVAAGSLLLFAQSACFVALGTLISMMSPNQIVSGIACFLSVWATLLLGWLLSLVPWMPRPLTDFLSASTHIEDFARGSIDARPLVLYASCTAFLIFLSIRLLESRRWK